MTRKQTAGEREVSQASRSEEKSVGTVKSDRKRQRRKSKVTKQASGSREQ